jgi:hypothetical protein
VAGLLVALATGAAAALDVDVLWNFNDPAASEARFRALLANASGDDAQALRTQIVPAI